MAEVLLYNIHNPDKLRRIRTVLLRRGIAGRAVTYEEYGHPIGYLTGYEGFEAAAPYTGEDFADEMLLLDGFASGELSRFLDDLRAARATVSLKAVVTAHNAPWSSAELHAAVKEEHETMRELRERKGK